MQNLPVPVCFASNHYQFTVSDRADFDMARETVEIRFPAWKQTPMIAELFHKKRHCELTLISALCSEVNVLGNAGNALEQLFENGDTIQAEEIQCHR